MVLWLPEEAGPSVVTPPSLPSADFAPSVPLEDLWSIPPYYASHGWLSRKHFFNTSDSSLLTKEAHIQRNVSFGFFCVSYNHLFNWVSGSHHTRPQQGSVSSESDEGSVQSWDLLIFLTILVPIWNAFKTASCVACLKARGLWQECGFYPISVAKSLLVYNLAFLVPPIVWF